MVFFAIWGSDVVLILTQALYMSRSLLFVTIRPVVPVYGVTLLQILLLQT